MRRIAQKLAAGPRTYWCAEGQVFELREVTTAHLAELGFPEAIGAAEAWSAMQEAALLALARRKNRDGAELVAREAERRAGAWLEELAESPAKLEEFHHRTGVWFAAAVTGVGEARPGTPDGACALAAAEYLEPVRVVLDLAAQDLEADAPRVYLGAWLPSTREVVAMRAMAAREAIATSLKSFRGAA